MDITTLLKLATDFISRLLQELPPDKKILLLYDIEGWAERSRAKLIRETM